MAMSWRIMDGLLEHRSGSLSISNISPSDAGNYTIIITNSYGAVTGAVATLSVVGTNLLANGGFELPIIGSNTVSTVAPDGWAWMVYGQLINGSFLFNQYYPALMPVEGEHTLIL